MNFYQTPFYVYLAIQLLTDGEPWKRACRAKQQLVAASTWAGVSTILRICCVAVLVLRKARLQVREAQQQMDGSASSCVLVWLLDAGSAFYSTQQNTA